ncbi:hypothetical protein M0802_015682 [Mischocyttarus mexicanus]|nr:hypothetical protein M0802_015682 [Mischocyttarus mexicanus]
MFFGTLVSDPLGLYGEYLREFNNFFYRKRSELGEKEKKRRRDKKNRRKRGEEEISLGDRLHGDLTRSLHDSGGSQRKRRVLV